MPLTLEEGEKVYSTPGRRVIQLASRGFDESDSSLQDCTCSTRCVSTSWDVAAPHLLGVSTTSADFEPRCFPPRGIQTK